MPHMNIDSEMELKIYYREIFPVEILWKTLELNDKRELSFFTDSGYLRYLVFDTPAMFREKLDEITPRKVDLGPNYNVRPTKSNGAIPVSRELVFDIDLTDYQRSCCQEKKVCEECYERIKCAVKILDYSMANEFGFKNYGFVFSGRRGVHCWVLDMKEMSGYVRNNIFKFFNRIVAKNLSVPSYNKILEKFDSSDPIQKFFPRLDKQVTVSMNHLLKMPFSVHPETFKISVPLDPNNITEFKDLPSLKEVVANPEILQPYIHILERWRL